VNLAGDRDRSIWRRRYYVVSDGGGPFVAQGTELSPDLTVHYIAGTMDEARQFIAGGRCGDRVSTGRRDRGSSGV